MKIRSFVLLFFVLAAGLTAAACGSPTSATTVSTVTVVGIVPNAGSSAQFTAMATLASGSTQDVSTSSTWSSSNTAVATVTTSGYVTALTSGSAVITATYSGIAGSDTISVP